MIAYIKDEAKRRNDRYALHLLTAYAALHKAGETELHERVRRLLVKVRASYAKPVYLIQRDDATTVSCGHNKDAMVAKARDLGKGHNVWMCQAGFADQRIYSWAQSRDGSSHFGFACDQR